MRYENVRDRLDAFQAARAACSREWELSPNTVMCLELDVGSAAMRVDLESSRLSISEPNLVRITYYDVAINPPSGISSAMLSMGELAKARDLLAAVERWTHGEESALPPSTSCKMEAAVRARSRRGR